MCNTYMRRIAGLVCFQCMTHKTVGRSHTVGCMDQNGGRTWLRCLVLEPFLSLPRLKAGRTIAWALSKHPRTVAIVP